MKKFSFVAAALVFAAIFAGSAAAQSLEGKVGLVNTFMFGDEKEGITKYKNAVAALDKEFDPTYTQLKATQTKLQTLATEIENLRKPPAANVPAKDNTAALQAKAEEYQSLDTKFKRDQEDAKTKYERRYQAVVGPVYADIIKAMNEYASSKGYSVILDGAKLEQADILLGFNPKFDVTKDFITFYNSRPAGTAAAAKP